MAGPAVEGAGAGDEPQRRSRRAAVDALGREGGLGLVLPRPHREAVPPAGAIDDDDAIAAPQPPEPREHRRARARVDVPRDHGRAAPPGPRAAAPPSGAVGVARRREAPVAQQTQALEPGRHAERGDQQPHWTGRGRGRDPGGARGRLDRRLDALDRRRGGAAAGEDGGAGGRRRRRRVSSARPARRRAAPAPPRREREQRGAHQRREAPAAAVIALGEPPRPVSTPPTGIPAARWAAWMAALTFALDVPLSARQALKSRGASGPRHSMGTARSHAAATLAGVKPAHSKKS